MARAIFRITALDLFEKSGVGLAIIERLEARRGVPSVHARILDEIQKALSALGVEFVGTPKDRPSVRLITVKK